MARSFASGNVIVGSNNQINFERTNTFSVHGWVRLASATSVAESIIGHLDPATSFRGWEIEKTNVSGGGNPAGAFNVYLVNTFSSNTGEVHGSVVPAHNGATWATVGFTYSGSSTAAGVTIYNNGIADPAPFAVFNTLSATIRNSIPLRFGKRNDASEPFTGSMADFGIWNVTLTASEMLALANGARPFNVRPSSLVAYFPLDGLQSPEPDLSGFANNGTLTGTTPTSGPPLMPFTPRWPRNFDPAVAAPTFLPAFARHRNVVEGGRAS